MHRYFFVNFAMKNPRCRRNGTENISINIITYFWIRWTGTRHLAFNIKKEGNVSHALCKTYIHTDHNLDNSIQQTKILMFNKYLCCTFINKQSLNRLVWMDFFVKKVTKGDVCTWYRQFHFILKFQNHKKNILWFMFLTISNC